MYDLSGLSLFPYLLQDEKNMDFPKLLLIILCVRIKRICIVIVLTNSLVLDMHVLYCGQKENQVCAFTICDVDASLRTRATKDTDGETTYISARPSQGMERHWTNVSLQISALMSAVSMQSVTTEVLLVYKITAWNSINVSGPHVFRDCGVAHSIDGRANLGENKS